MSFLIAIAATFAAYVATSLFLLFNPRILHSKRIDTIKKRRRRRYVHISHRGGAAEAYENTLEGFRRAVNECGTQMLELDVHMTKDGVVVVSHDMHLGRLCGADVRVDQLNYDELPEIKRRVPIDSEPGLMFEGKEEDDRKIPTLRSVFEAFPEVGINIDVKSCDARLVAAVDRLVRQCEREDSTVWGSFAHETCALCERANPRVGLLFSFRRVIQTLGLFYAGLLPFVDVPETHFEIPMISSFKAVSLGQLGLTKPPRSAFGNFVAGALDAILMRPWMFRHLRARGIEVYLWVLNSDKEFDKALRCGASGVMTDYPTRLRSYLDRLDIAPAHHSKEDG